MRKKSSTALIEQPSQPLEQLQAITVPYPLRSVVDADDKRPSVRYADTSVSMTVSEPGTCVTTTMWNDGSISIAVFRMGEMVHQYRLVGRDLSGIDAHREKWGTPEPRLKLR